MPNSRIRAPADQSRFAAIGVLAAASVAGLAVSSAPGPTTALAVALAFAAVALVDLPLAMALWLPLVFVGAVPGADTAWHAGAGLLALVALGGLAGRDDARRATLRAHAPTLLLIAALVTWLIVSLAWAERPGVARTALLAWIASAVMVVVVLSVIVSPRAVRLLLTSYVVGVSLSVLIGLVGSELQPPSTMDTLVVEAGRLRGAIGDPNYLAASIVPAIALALALRVGARTRWGRAAWLGVVGLLLVGLVETESRGGFVAATIAVAAAIVLMRRRPRAVLGVAAVVICSAGLLVATPGALERLTTTQDEGSGRVGLTTVAWRIVEDNPLVGVGLSNYPVHSLYYVREPGAMAFVELIAERGLPVHNTYLQLLAETGPVGLLLFLAACAACLRAAWRAARLLEARRRVELAALAWAVLVGGIGALSASIFLSNGSDVQLWLLLAAGPALELLARRDAGGRPRAAPR